MHTSSGYFWNHFRFPYCCGLWRLIELLCINVFKNFAFCETRKFLHLSFKKINLVRISWTSDLQQFTLQLFFIFFSNSYSFFFSSDTWPFSIHFEEKNEMAFTRLMTRNLRNLRERQQLGFVTLNNNLAVSGLVGLAYDL